MADQPDLSLPSDLPEGLREWYFWYLEESRLPIYSLVDIGKDGIQDVFTAIDDEYHDYMGSDKDEAASKVGIPDVWDFSSSGASLKDVFHYHINKLDWQVSPWGHNKQSYWYVPGFVVVVSQDWRKRGLLLVHCDEDLDDQGEPVGREMIGSCMITAEELGAQLWSLLVSNWSFQDLKSYVEQDKTLAL